MPKTNARRWYWCRFLPYIVRNKMRTKCVTFFRFQKRCIDWLKRRRISNKTNGAIANLDVGFGKTAIGLYHGRQFGWNVLYLCPTNVVTHVSREILKHFGPKIRVQVAESWPSFTETSCFHVTIMSFYAISRLDHDVVQKNNHWFKTCIVDEVQDAETKPGVKRFVKELVQADFFIGLTAAEKITLGPICELLHAPSSYKNIFTFRQPPHFNVQQIYFTMSPSICSQYKAIEQSVVSGKETGLRKHQRLKDAWELLSLDKVQYVIEYLNKIPPHYKVVIVSNYVATLRALSLKLPKSRYMLLDTKLQGQDRRQLMLDKFEKSDIQCTFLLASMEIVYLGINLGFADVLAKMDTCYAADSNVQLNGRFRRSGQSPQNVRVQHIVEFITKDTCDEKLFRSNQIMSA